MNAKTTASRSRPVRLLDWSTLWPLAAAAALCAAIVGTWLLGLRNRLPAIGDGHQVDSYHFDLSTCLVPRMNLVAAGVPKDGLPALVEPAVFTLAEVEAFTEELKRGHMGKFLTARDRVIGVEVDGQARAYPLEILNWHEVANDTVGGRPLLITYNPLCDSAVVFDRRVGAETLTFGFSGLLYNSNLLLYDKRPQGQGESLWSQLQFRAIAGPAAANRTTLKPYPAVLAHWSDWKAAHPDTTVLAPDRSRLKLYRRTYEPYFGSDTLRYPVQPLPPPDGPHAKARVLALEVGGQWHVFEVLALVQRVGPQGTWRTELGGVPVTLAVRDDPPCAWPVVDSGAPLPVAVPAFWFGWHALHPDVPRTPVP